MVDYAGDRHSHRVLDLNLFLGSPRTRRMQRSGHPIEYELVWSCGCLGVSEDPEHATLLPCALHRALPANTPVRKAG